MTVCFAAEFHVPVFHLDSTIPVFGAQSSQSTKTLCSYAAKQSGVSKLDRKYVQTEQGFKPSFNDSEPYSLSLRSLALEVSKHRDFKNLHDVTDQKKKGSLTSRLPTETRRSSIRSTYNFQIGLINNSEAKRQFKCDGEYRAMS